MSETFYHLNPELAGSPQLSSKYIETYQIAGAAQYGIKRVATTEGTVYTVWRNGCGIGTSADIDQARATVFSSALSNLNQTINAANATAREAEGSLIFLNHMGLDIWRRAPGEEPRYIYETKPPQEQNDG